MPDAQPNPTPHPPARRLVAGRLPSAGVPDLSSATPPSNPAGSGDPAYNATGDVVGRLPSAGLLDLSSATPPSNPAGSGDPAYNATGAGVGRLPSAGVPDTSSATLPSNPAGSGDPAYNATGDVVGRLPSAGFPDLSSASSSTIPAGSGDPAYNAASDEPPPRRLRRLHRVWPDRDGNISFLLTLCVEGRARVLDNDLTFQRLTAFLLDSPARYRWFPRRFVVMPDHLHLIAHQGHEAVRLGQWIKALKAVVGGLERRTDSANAAGSANPAGSGDPAYTAADGAVGRLPPAGVGHPHEFARLKRAWRWQEGFHDHKFRTSESEQRKWEYVCLNPVRYRLVERPEQWAFGGEIFHPKRSSGPGMR